MTTESSRLRIRSVAFTISAILMTVGICVAATEQVIYNFPKTGSGAGVVLTGDAGRMYGTAPTGGKTACYLGCGLIFEFGGANYHVLYEFSGGADGAYPTGKMVLDGIGDLYAAVNGGGAYGYGGVVKLSRGAVGWIETTLYSFNPNNGVDGSNPAGGLTMDAGGNLYGTTIYGGANGGIGTVYKLTNYRGTWTYSKLYGFFPRPDGQYPRGEVIFDSAGNIYGTTVYGGASDLGSVYELSPGSGGTWTERIIYTFDGTYGQTPEGPVSMDAAGNLYCLTNSGGARSEGTAMELTPNSNGTWSPVLLHSFGGQGDGGFPNGGLTPGGGGAFYGTTFIGGANNGGVVFRLKQQSNGQWSESLLHSFSLANDGYSPVSGVTVGPGNALFGGTGYGGTNSDGVIYEVTP